MKDLKDRGLLDSTMVVWMGEFGRTAVINDNGGRDHFPNAWTTVLGGGGIRGGQVYGKTDEGGATVADKPVNVPDLLATICMGLGIDPTKENMSNVGRPIPLTDRPGSRSRTFSGRSYASHSATRLRCIGVRVRVTPAPRVLGLA